MYTSIEKQVCANSYRCRQTSVVKVPSFHQLERKTRPWSRFKSRAIRNHRQKKCSFCQRFEFPQTRKKTFPRFFGAPDSAPMFNGKQKIFAWSNIFCEKIKICSTNLVFVKSFLSDAPWHEWLQAGLGFVRTNVCAHWNSVVIAFRRIRSYGNEHFLW